MDQEDTMDFKALRARFQEEELLMQTPRVKPALPEKPKAVRPPTSPTSPSSPPHYLPAGARPSLLTSISKSLDGKSSLAPRVVFKDDKKESKKPLIQSNSKGKDKSEGKVKKDKDKTTKVSKEKLEGSSLDQKEKKENKRFSLALPAAKEKKEELVPAATPPPKASTSKKKGLLGLKKITKRAAEEIPAEPILDTPSLDGPGPVPLIPVPSGFGDTVPEPEAVAPEALVLSNISTLPDPIETADTTPPFSIPTSPQFTPPPTFIPEIPTPKRETPVQIETPALATSRPASQNEIIHRPPSTVPTPPPNHLTPTPSPSPPEPEAAADAILEALNRSKLETPPPPPATDPGLLQVSPKPERPISALSALSRAEDMNMGKKTPVDQRIFNALEKARRKTSSPHPTPSTSYSITPPPEEYPRPQSPDLDLPELPPIDYEDRMRKGLPPLQTEDNGLDHREASPELEDVSEVDLDPVPELLLVPPPPPRNLLPDPGVLGPAPEKPDRPPSVNLNQFIPPHVDDSDISGLLDMSGTDTTDIPEFDDVTSGAQSPELPVSDWRNREYNGSVTPEPGHSLPQLFANGIATPAAEVHTPTVFGGQDNLTPEPSLPISHESPPRAGLNAGVENGLDGGLQNNTYEEVSSSNTKKKGKSDGGKKRKGPPKNPYAEAAQENNEEKSKTGRFGRLDKKASAEGPDDKELKKKEKQRLEKEKKELKEKQEREKKEQKERDKKENEIKKKFKITGHEDAMYQATVTVTTKGRKNDLPVTSGDVISIIRTTNCPKGKWLARDSSNNYGHVAVDHVELDIKEMLELGKKAAIGRNSTGNTMEAEAPRSGSRTSNHYPISAGSFEEDSEEWTPDDDEPVSPHFGLDPMAQMGHNRALSMPDMGDRDIAINHQHSHSDLNPDGSHMQARHEALQKLATFFHAPKPVEPAASSTKREPSPVQVKEEVISHPPEASATQEIDLNPSDMLILPPPDLYADFS